MSSAVSPIISSTISAPKQIRFVNNEGQPPAKRRRINAACRTCRKRKIRCDGKKPLCSTCIDNGHECLGYADVGGSGGAREKPFASSMRSGEDDRESDDDDRTTTSHALVDTPRSAGSGTSSYFDVSKGQPMNSIQVKDEEDRKHNIQDTVATYGEASTIVAQSPTSADDDSPPARHEGLRVPYFRYFGPTAIVPGYKQMVVAVQSKADRAGSVAALSPGSGGYGSVHGGFTPSQASADGRPSMETPAYDPGDPLPVHRLIIHLVETFFTHLGCNYPFLQKDKFQRAVEDKRVDAILVDAVCSLAARFSDHPLLTFSKNPKYPKSEHGKVFARRAKMALVDTFPCPSVSSVQACLLLAYEGFGSNQDSALWMQLGCAIRMAQDLGLNKLQGVKPDEKPDDQRTDTDSSSERKDIDQQRLDTLWAVFMLDRVISSGTGRPVTLKDADLELSFPDMASHPTGDWPDPFPALIQIIHLYGRVTDLINNIRDLKDVTQEKMDGLAGMENDLTKIYQKLDQRLIFSASNFQHYVKSGQGTNFILVHFWFHTLIMLLHQPTLLHSLEGGIHQLLPNSHELSMSSAKTIADILAFAELIDPKSFIGNPFVSQPIYIAASAFLMETVTHASQPTSRDPTPPQKPGNNVRFSNGKGNANQKQSAKHTLLATAANQNYQRCYKALEQLEKYWAGTRYLLTALDQKAKGIWDPETYTSEEMESTKINPDVSLAAQNWRRKMGTGFAAQSPKNVLSPTQEIPGSPVMDPSHAIGWSLTGTTNSPSSNLAFLYQSVTSDQHHNVAPHPVSSASTPYYDPIRQNLPESAPTMPAPSYNQSPRSIFPGQQHHSPHEMLPPVTKYTSIPSDGASTSDAEMLLGLQHSPYSPNTPGSSAPQRSLSYDHSLNPAMATNTHPNNQERHYQSYELPNNQDGLPFAGNGFMGMGGIGDMTIESQDIHMSALAPDMGTWLEYLPQDVINFFDSSTTGETHEGVDMNHG